MPRMSKKRKHELSFTSMTGACHLQRIMPEMPAWVQAELRAVVADRPRYLSKRAKKKEEHTE